MIVDPRADGSIADVTAPCGVCTQDKARLALRARCAIRPKTLSSNNMHHKGVANEGVSETDGRVLLCLVDQFVHTNDCTCNRHSQSRVSGCDGKIGMPLQA